MIEDLLEGILQGVCPPDTAQLGVVPQDTGDVRGRADAIHHRRVATLTIETGEIRKIAGGTIPPEGIHLDVDPQTDERIHPSGEENLQNEGGTLRIEGNLQVGEEGILRKTETYLQNKNAGSTRLEEILLKGGHLRLQGENLHRRDHLKGRLLLMKDLWKEKSRLRGGNRQFAEKVHLIEEKSLQNEGRNHQKEGRILRATGSHHRIKRKDPLIARLDRKRTVRLRMCGK